MKTLIRREFISILSSGTGIVFSFTFLVISGLMVWLFPGSFNIPDSGYASLEKFFLLAPILLIVLVPALTMKLFSEEKRSGTLMLLRSRPVSMPIVWFSKWSASFLFVTFVILSTVVYVYVLYQAGNPRGNLDYNIIPISYISLLALSGIFICSGILASSLSGNQVVTFIIALLINFFIYYGFELASNLFLTGKQQLSVTALSLNYHFSKMQKGQVELTGIAFFVFYFVLFYSSVIYLLDFKNKLYKKSIFASIILTVFLFTAAYIFPYAGMDFTPDKRYTLSDYSKNLMSEIKNSDDLKIKVNVYLDGDLNAGFQKLRNSVQQTLSDLNRYAGNKLEISFIDPSDLGLFRKDVPQYMSEMGMPAIVLNEVDRAGKLTQQMIYPYSQLIISSPNITDTLQISFLNNISGSTAEEKLNASVENIEFQFADALSVLQANEEMHIAFIEGHGELPRAYVYDAEELLSKYFFINRGYITNDVTVLDQFKAVIIAGPVKKYTEAEKYILDQYLMKGGRILLLLDGVYLSKEDLAEKGQSASIKNDANLDDLLFNYGLRVQPNLLQDTRATQIVVNTGTESQPVTLPWYYSLLLVPSPENAITKNIADIKAVFASNITFTENNTKISANVLLSTGMHSHIVTIPELINYDIRHIQTDPEYFNNSFLPVAVALEGSFSSAFLNRMIPDSVYSDGHVTLNESKNTKMIVVASSDIIRNEIVGQDRNTRVLPMGFDKFSGNQYGNRDFILNAVNWLVNDDLMKLRAKSRKMNLLDKQNIYENKTKYVLINVFIPLLFIGVIWICVNIGRKKKYTK